MANPQKVLATVGSIYGFGEGNYEVVFTVAKRYTRFLPGQFLHLTLDSFDPTTGYWPESRVFSIASRPGTESVTIVYSVKGAYTRRMERELVVGREVWLKLPYGSFVIDEASPETGAVVLIAGGTGISPYIPFLAERLSGSGRVELFYGVRKPENILFRDTLQAAASVPGFRLHLFIEEGQDVEFSGSAGRLSISQVSETLGEEFASGRFYLSGPPAMIRSFRSDLGGSGIPEDRIHIDEWE